ncbi:hypothetical protein Sjap_016546 [Stephania japonica]|uniref:Uncharacterized protein n=1 Tax=Stephania japonica TaxID=461633 RepID=A0AAP0IL75_9MAGN
MKNLYHHKSKGKVHPSLDPTSPNSRDALLTMLKLLPTAIIALVSALTVEDREVLAYLITRSIKTTSPTSVIEEKKKCKRPINRGGTHKPPMFDCGCFECYTSYWYRWDSSPNRELIHQAIEAFEDHLTKGERSPKTNRAGRKRDHYKGHGHGQSRLVGKKCEVGLGKFVPALEDLENKRDLADESDESLKTEQKTEHCEEKNRVSDASDDAVAVVVKEKEEEEEEEEEQVEEKHDMGVAGNLVESTGNATTVSPVTSPMTGHRVPARKVVPDVFGLFNSRFWSLWNPSF